MLEQSGAHRPLGGGTATGQRWKQLLGRFLAAASLLGNVQTLQKSLVMGSLKQNFIWPEILGKQNKNQPIKKPHKTSLLQGMQRIPLQVHSHKGEFSSEMYETAVCFHKGED